MKNILKLSLTFSALIFLLSISDTLAEESVMEIEGEIRMVDQYSLNSSHGYQYYLFEESSQAQYKLNLDNLSADWTNLNNKQVAIKATQSLIPEGVAASSDGELHVTEMSLMETLPSAYNVSPTTPPANVSSVTLLSKFADVSAEPHNAQYFQNRFYDDFDSLRQFYLASSYGLFSWTGSVSDWKTVSLNQLDYRSGGFPNFNLLITDAIALHDPTVNFSGVTSLILVFNAILDPSGSVWGSIGIWDTFQTAEGPITVRVTWEYDQGSWFPVGEDFDAGIGVTAHELGHNIEFAHTPAPPGDWLGGVINDPYHDPWSIMSSNTDHAGPSGLIMGQRDQVGWVASDDKVTIPQGTSSTVTLDYINQPASGTNPHMVIVPLPSGNSYIIEAHTDEIFNDTPFDNEGIVMYNFFPSGNQYPYLTVDGTGFDKSAKYGLVATSGTEFEFDFTTANLDVGETYTDANNVLISTLSKTPTSVTVLISNDGPLVPPLISSAKITGPNTITIIYTKPVNSVQSDYTNLILSNGGPRPITNISGSGTNQIELTFGNPPAAGNDSAIIDIANTVTDFESLSFAGVTALEVTDGQIPTLTSVSISSSNLTNSELATVGDTVTLSFTATEPLETLTVILNGIETLNAINTVGNTWEVSVVMQEGQVEGLLSFTIDFTDTATNPGLQVTSTTDSSSVSFTQNDPSKGIVTGVVFADSNNNGIQDGVETGIAEATVILVDGTGTQLPNATTDANGSFTFTNVAPGGILVQVAPVPALHLPSTGFTSFSFPTLTAGQTLTVNFPLEPITPVDTATVTGTLYEDSNNNGVQDPGELGLQGVQVFVVDFLTLTQTTVTTDANGSYTATGILPDAVLVQAAPLPALHLSSTGFNSFSFPTLARGATQTIDFPLQPIAAENLATIQGVIYQDNNGNGVKDAEDPGIPNSLIFAFELITAQQQTIFSDANGNYSFTGLIPDVVLVQQIPAAGITPTVPEFGFQFPTLTAGESLTIDFANSGFLASPVTDLTATAISESQIDLAWSTPPVVIGGGAVTGYMIEVESPVGGGFGPVTFDTGSAVTTFSHIGLQPGTLYNYRVSPINAAGLSAGSNEASATTSIIPQPPVIISPADNSSFEVNELFTVSGTSDAGALIELLLDDVVVKDETADSAGNWSFINFSISTIGLHTIAADATISGSTVEGDSITVNITAVIGPLSITSSAFVNNGVIPTIHADTFCGGTNLSPPLEFSGVPANAQSLALIMEDASFGSLTHWIFWNLPATTTSISAGADDTLSAISGNNAADFAGYLGPCPPPSETHDYHFTLYALDTNVNLVNGSTKAQLTSAIQNNIIEQATLVGQFTGS